MPTRALAALLTMIVVAASAFAAEPPIIRAGVELEFRPYSFIDVNGHESGFGVELLQVVAGEMGLSLHTTSGSWNSLWNDLVADKLDVLPVVARTPGRERLVDFSLPHTETFDAFFYRNGAAPIADLAAAAGKSIVVVNSDAAHHQLLERRFTGTIVTVENIPDGLRLIAAGKHDALLCSKVIGVLEREQGGIEGVVAGPVIPDYKRSFSFAVRKGNNELVEKLNQGLHIVKATGAYDRLYSKWLGEDSPPPTWWQTPFWRTGSILAFIAWIAGTWIMMRQALTLDLRRSQGIAPGNSSEALLHYGLAVVAVTAAYVVRIGLQAWSGTGLPPFVTYYPAVMFAALLGGFWPGILATALVAVIAALSMLPTGSLANATRGDQLGLVMFCGMGLFMAGVAELYRRNRAKAAAFDRETVVRHSEERFRLLVEQAVDGIFLADAQGHYVDANAAGTQMLGYTLDEIRRMTFIDVVIPEEAVFMPDEMSNLAKGEVITSEWHFRRKDGSTFIGEVVGRQLSDGRLLGILRDVSARKAAEDALRDSESKLALALDIAQLGTWHWDVLTGDIVWSPQCKAVYGLPADATVTYERFLHWIHPDDRERAVAALQQVLATKGHYGIEKRIVWADGTVRWIASLGRAICDDTGQLVRVSGVTMDITDRKRNEEAVAWERDLLQCVMNSAGNAHLVYLDRDFNFVRVNETYAASSGFRPEEMIGKNHFALYPHAENEAIFRRVRDTGEPFEVHDKPFEFPNQPERGITYWDWTLFPVKDADGQVTALIFSLFETTARKRAEEQQARNLDAMTRLQRLGELSAQEDNLEKVLAEIVAAAIAISGAAFGDIQLTDPARGGRDSVDAGTLAVQSTPLVSRSGKPVGVLSLHYRQPGRLDDHRLRLLDLLALQAADIVVHAQAAVALRESEQRYRTLFDSMTEGFAVHEIVTDAEGQPVDYRFLDVNPAFERLTGLKRTKLIGKRVLEVLPDTESHWIESYGRVALTGEPVHFDNYSAALGCWYEVIAYQPAPRQFAVVFSDISERKAMSTALAEAKEAAERANSAKSAFLADMSHEMRTPLNAIVGLCHLFKRDLGEDPRLQTRLDQMISASEHLTDLIRDVLDLSRIEAGRLVLDLGDFRLGDLITRVLEVLASPARIKGLALAMDISPELLDRHWRGDALRLTQVLINLGSNAVKFTERGSVRLSVKACGETARGTRLRFAVTDTGKGIAREDQARLFVPFTQVGVDAAHKEGSGLGLIISQRLIHAMASHIDVSSAPGVGSTFTFEVELPPADAGQRSAPPATAPDFARRRVLLAEDDMLSQEIMCAMLKDLGCLVDAAGNGAEALARALDGDYDLILLDMRLPKMDGLAAARAIRSSTRHTRTPIIAVSANAFAEDRQRCIEAGMNAHLAKPVTPARLATALAQWLPEIGIAGTLPDGDLALGALAAVAGLDTSKQLLRTPKEVASYVSLLQRFVTEEGCAVETLRRSVDAGDDATVGDIAHRLSGVAGFLGARRVAAAAGRIDIALRQGQPIATVSDDAAACAEAMTELAAALDALPAV